MYAFGMYVFFASLTTACIVVLFALVLTWFFRKSPAVRHFILMLSFVVVGASPLFIAGARTTGFHVFSIHSLSNNQWISSADWHSLSMLRQPALEGPTVSHSGDASRAATDVGVNESSKIHHGSQLNPWALPKPSLPTIIIVIWSMVCLWMVGRLLWKMVVLRRLYARAIGTAPTASKRIQAIAIRVAKQIEVSNVPKICLVDDVNSPVVIGFWRPIVLLPRQAENLLSNDEMEAIILHEFAHVLRRDPVQLLLQKLVVAMHWVNPLVHVAHWQLVCARESICDNYAIAHIDRKKYSRVLLKATELFGVKHHSTVLGLNWISGKSFAQRIENLVFEKESSSTKIGLIHAVPIGGLILSVLIFASSCPSCQASYDRQVEVSALFVNNQPLLARK